MGGSGGGGGSGVSPARIKEKLREAARSFSETFRADLQSVLDEFVGEANARDVGLTTERRDAVISSLSETLETDVLATFGGSVQKKTYVEGISDIDILVIPKGSTSADFTPSSLRKEIVTELAKVFGDAHVKPGKLAVTVTFDDGMEMQLVPAIREGGALHVPAWNGDKWSEIDPTKFRKKLSAINDKCNGKLVPTIKLAKLINQILPDAYRLSGYHLESLGIQAFKAYSGVCTTAAMLPEYFRQVSKLVLKPIVDSSGQSVHVDEDLGAANSSIRKDISHVFERIAKRMDNASFSESTDQWRAFFRPDE